MRRFLAVRRAACSAFIVMGPACTAGAQVWNDSLSRALVERAVQRRAQQLADTGLVDYRATAHGYVSFLAQVGEGFLTPPKLLKSDELELEVYWHAPNQSKQRIIGRRDTLLLPTDIQYHRDHLAIIQNNFPNAIRVGDGDEVRDVPHPASPVGLGVYDFAITDSFAIGSGAQRIRVYEVKVRPKDDRQPRVVGALYIDPAQAQIVRMNLSFTRAAFLDEALEELSIVLENRLVAGRYWLPSEQHVEIRRNGEWLDYPIRGVIRGRWVIGDYQLNMQLAPSVFVGPEIVQVPADQLKAYPWKGRLLDSLPADVRGAEDPDIQRVQEEARELVRARALERAQSARLSARNVSDFVRFNRVEGLSLGGGVAKQIGSGFSVNARARYGIDDRMIKGAATVGYSRADGFAIRAFASRDFRDVGDVTERSTAINSIAAQEFASDVTDPYLVRAVGATLELPLVMGFRPRLTGSYERRSGVNINATPVTGTFDPTLPVQLTRATRASLELEHPRVTFESGAGLTMRAELRGTFPHLGDLARLNPERNATVYRAAGSADFDYPLGATTLATTTAGAWAAGSTSSLPFEELVYVGGPVSGPGYAYHSIATRGAFTEHVELRIPAPFIPFSLGRFGRVPARGAIAPFVHLIGAREYAPVLCIPPESGVVFDPIPTPNAGARFGCDAVVSGFYSSAGAAYVLPFDLVRIEVARGFQHRGRWTFNVDISRDLWSIL